MTSPPQADPGVRPGAAEPSPLAGLPVFGDDDYELGSEIGRAETGDDATSASKPAELAARLAATAAAP